MNKNDLIVLSFFPWVLFNFSSIIAQTIEVQSEHNSTIETYLKSSSTNSNNQRKLSVDTTDCITTTGPALTDEDISMVDNGGARTDSVTEDSLPPIEKMPVLKKFIVAEYPKKIIKRGIEGTVILELLVNDSGKVDSVSIIKGVNSELDRSAVKAALSFVFEPAVAGGETVPVLIQYEYRFELDEAVGTIQEYVNFKGTLIEQGTKKPIANAMVVITFIDSLSDTSLPVPFGVYLQRIGNIEGQYLEENRLVTITDSSGNFKFYSLPACTLQISVPLPGYEVLTEKELITRNEETTVKYYIHRVSYSDYEIVVYGKVEEKEVSRRRITLAEIKNVPGFGGDAVKIVQAMPGVARPLLGDGSVVVRGAPTWDSQFYLDGMILPRLYHFGGIKSVYNSSALEAVDFYPGGFNTRYGNSIGGVIEITGRGAKTDRWYETIDLSIMDGSFLVEGPVTNKLSLMGSARRSFIGDILSWYVNNSEIDFPITVTPFYWDYLLRGDYTFSSNNRAYCTLFGGRDSLTFLSPYIVGGSTETDAAADQPGIKQTFHMGIIGWDWMVNDKCENSLRYSLTFDDDRQSAGDYLSEYHSVRNNIRNQITCLPGDKSRVVVGIDVDILNYDMILIKTQENGIIQRDTSDNWSFGDIGAYVNFEWKPVDRLLIIPGLRYDYYPELHYDGSVVPEFWQYKSVNTKRGISGEPSLRLTIRYEFLKKHTAKLSIGNYSQTPKPLAQVIHEIWGDPRMPSTKAAHYVWGYEWQLTDLISSDIQFYINRQWDIPRYADPEDLDLSNTDQKLWFGDEKGRMYGMEILLRHGKSGRFFGWIAYSLSRAERYNPTTRKWELFGEDETHNIQLVGSWHLGREWDIGFRTRYITGKPVTPVIGSIEDENGNFIEPIYGPKNADRIDPFFQLDLRIDKKIVFDKWMFTVYLDMINSSYFIYKSPEMEMWNEFYDDKTTVSNIFTPALGLRAEF